MMTIHRILLILLCFIGFASASDIGHVDKRIRTVTYSKDTIFKLDARYGFQSFIEFSDRETVKTIAMGSSIGWSINTIGNRIFVRPLERGIRTNMVIVTSMYTYVFDLHSLTAHEKKNEEKDGDESKEEKGDYILRFYYPDSPAVDNLAKPSESNQQDSLAKYSMTANQIHQNYSAVGNDTVLFDLVEILDNGNVTFFKFNGDKIPRIFTVDEERVERRLKMSKFKDYVVVDGVHQKLRLRYQSSMLEIVNDDLVG